MTDSPLRILLMAAEMVPFAKTGGLADVTGALPKALKVQGHDVRVAMPRYGRIDRERFQVEEVLAPFPVPMDDHSIAFAAYFVSSALAQSITMIGAPVRVNGA